MSKTVKIHCKYSHCEPRSYAPTPHHSPVANQRSSNGQYPSSHLSNSRRLGTPASAGSGRVVLASALATPQSNGVKALPRSASGHKSGYAAASLDHEAHVAGSRADSILDLDANAGDASGQMDPATQTQDEASGGTSLVLANGNSRADGGCSPSVRVCLLRGRYWIFAAGFVSFLFTRG